MDNVHKLYSFSYIRVNKDILNLFFMYLSFPSFEFKLLSYNVAHLCYDIFLFYLLHVNTKLVKKFDSVHLVLDKKLCTHDNRHLSETVRTGEFFAQ